MTSISLLTQTARTLATPANVIRAIDAVTAKPETTETLTVSTVALKQLASVVSDIPNIFIENEQAGSIIENDLKLAITDALDDLVKQSVAASRLPGTGHRSTLDLDQEGHVDGHELSGYSPDTLILRPADAETLDTLQDVRPEPFFVFAPATSPPASCSG